MTQSRAIGLIEAVLLLESEPVSLEGLSRITGLPAKTVGEAVVELQSLYADEKHGITLVEVGGGFLLNPKMELWEDLKERYGKKGGRRLSQAALETLSIVAYSQPITRAEIENIRGVKADGMMRLLLDRELIREVGKKDVPGKPTQYGTTREFLKLFGLKSIAHLPKLDELEAEKFDDES